MPKVMTIGNLPLDLPFIPGPGGQVPFNPVALNPGFPYGRPDRTLQPVPFLDWTGPGRVTPQYAPQYRPRPTNKGCGQTHTCLDAPTSIAAELRGLGALSAIRLGQTTEETRREMPEWVWPVRVAASTLGMGLGAYHGYKRTRKVGWTIVWALAGGLFPIITTVVAVAQGYGKRKGR